MWMERWAFSLNTLYIRIGPNIRPMNLTWISKWRLLRLKIKAVVGSVRELKMTAHDVERDIWKLWFLWLIASHTW
jgi:hypothetical protein